MPTPTSPQHRIAQACERFFEQHGDNYRGVGWTKSEAEVDLRYKVMLEVIDRDAPEPVELLDFGCGLAHLYEYLQKKPLPRALHYSGLDISSKVLDVAKTKFPELTFYELDLLTEPEKLPNFDYIVMNGVFNYKGDVTYEDMLAYWKALLGAVFPRARRGLAFNVMSTAVDWERDDLFHLPFSDLAAFVVNHLSRRFMIRHDYPLFEYTTYVYRDSET